MGWWCDLVCVYVCFSKGIVYIFFFYFFSSFLLYQSNIYPFVLPIFLPSFKPLYSKLFGHCDTATRITIYFFNCRAILSDPTKT